MRELLSTASWEDKLNGLTLEEMWCEIKESILEAVKLYVPIVMYNENKKPQRRKPVWMNDRALAALRRKKKSL